MPNVKAVFPGKDFLFMSRFVSKEERRYYLNGVQIEAGPLMVATDGHRLSVLRLTPEQGVFAGAASFILKADKNLLRACKCGTREQTIVICSDESVKVVTLSHSVNWKAPDMLEYTEGGVTFAATSLYVDGTFPDWRRVVPTDVTPKAGIDRVTACNPDYLAAFQSEGVVVSCASADPASPMLVTNNDPRFIGVLMLRRGDTAAEIVARRNAVLGGTL